MRLTSESSPPKQAWSPTVTCLHLCFCVACILSSNQGGEGTVIWGTFPWGCEGTVTRGRLLDKGVGG